MLPLQPPSNVSGAITSVLEDRAPESLVAAYLFGSHAELRAHRESDVDVGVLLDHGHVPAARERFEEGLRLATLLMPATAGRAVDVVVLNDVPPGLARHVVTTGQLLYCRDAEAEHAFRRDSQLRAADLEPFLRRLRRIKLDAIAR